MSLSTLITLYTSGECLISSIILGLWCLLWTVAQMAPALVEANLALTPGVIFSNYYLWTFITAGLVDTSFSMGLINILVFIGVAPMLEKSWGRFTFIKFILVVLPLVNFSLLLSMVFFYWMTESAHFLFDAICGFTALNAAFAIALKQKFANQTIIHSVDSIRFKHLPLILFLISFILFLTGNMGGKECPFILFGLFYAWVYLRYFLRDEQTGQTGDLRPDFRFHTLFSVLNNIPPVHHLLIVVENITFTIVNKTGLLDDAIKSSQTLPTTNNQSLHQSSSSSSLNSSAAASVSVSASSFPSSTSSSSIVTTVPATDRPVIPTLSDPTAERRRLLAIKAIDEKLAELAKAETTAPTSLVSNIAADASGAIEITKLPNEDELKKLEASLLPNATAN